MYFVGFKTFFYNADPQLDAFDTPWRYPLPICPWNEEEEKGSKLAAIIDGPL